MYRLVYYSENRIPKPADDFEKEMRDILEKSRSNNRLVGITGALMFSGGFFGQVLEGPQAAVEATFERIQQDIRHGDVALLEFVSISARAFDNWAMAYVGNRPEIYADWNNENWLVDHTLSGQVLFEKLRSMVSTESAA